MSPRSRRTLGVILIFGGLISIGVGLRLGFPPAQFAARSRIKIEQDLNATNTYSAEFMHNEFELIQSDVILAKVVEVLGLPHKWSQRTGKRLDAGKTLAMLKTQLELRPVRCTSLVEIHITSNDPAEAAEISNAVAEEYRNHRPTGGSSPISAELVDTATPPKRSVTPNRVRALGWLGLGTTLAISGICVFARRGTN